MSYIIQIQFLHFCTCFSLTFTQVILLVSVKGVHGALIIRLVCVKLKGC